MEACVILCPHETIISKSEADFDTQRRRRAPRDLEGSVATLLRLPNRFAPLAKVCVVTHFIIVGRLLGSAASYGVPLRHGLRRATSLLNPSATACAVPPPFKKGRHYGRLLGSAASYGVPLPKRLPCAKGAHEARALWAKQREVSPMRAKETAQPVAAIAVDEPSEAGSTASELANIGGPKGWSGEHTEQSAVRSHGTPRKRQRRAVRRRGATMLN